MPASAHEPVVTGSGRQAARCAPVQWVNTCLGNIKTALAGAYHHVSPKHAQRYLRAGSGNLDRGAEWSFCLTAARMAAGRERR